MRRLHDERGAALVMLIGIVVVLAILAATLVMVTANAQSGTSKDRTKTKSFNVAEAGIDAALYQLSASWPATAAQAPTLDDAAIRNAAIRSQFQGGADTYPDPPSGSADFVRVWAYDNSDTNGDKVIDTRDAAYDAFADGRMFVEAQAAVGSQTSRVVTEVQVAITTLNFQTGTAIYAGGDLVMDGVNPNKWAVGIVPGASSTQANVVTGGMIQPSKKSDYFGPNVSTQEKSSMTLYDVFPKATIDALILKAKTPNVLPYRYYTTGPLAEAAASPFAGVVVVDPPAPQFATVDLTTNSTSPESPGLLLVTRGNVINIGNDAKYYGLVVVLDTPDNNGRKGDSFDLGGNGNIQGMVFVAGNAKLHGEDKLWYDPSVANLLQNQNMYLKVRQVPNTWKEIQPK